MLVVTCKNDTHLLIGVFISKDERKDDTLTLQVSSNRISFAFSARRLVCDAIHGIDTSPFFNSVFACSVNWIYNSITWTLLNILIIVKWTKINWHRILNDTHVSCTCEKKKVFLFYALLMPNSFILVQFGMLTQPLQFLLFCFSLKKNNIMIINCKS